MPAQVEGPAAAALRHYLATMIDFRSFFNRYFPGGIPPLLVAMSGGRDSTVLAHGLWRANIPFEAAHVNYRLRSEDSDLDESFVASWCRERGIALHVRRLDDAEVDALRNSATQEQARDLRYGWFGALRAERGLQYVVVAHHAGDQAESVLFHFVRGSGWRGLSGMRALREAVLRPLLSTDPADIAAYAHEHGLTWREDASNETSDYSRNLIRHEIMPLLKQLNPGITATLVRQAEIFRDYETWSGALLAEALAGALTERGQREVLPIGHLMAHPAPRLLLWTWLGQHGWPAGAIAAAYELAESQPGRRVDYGGRQLVRDRDALVLEAHKILGIQPTWIHEETQLLTFPIILHIGRVEKPFALPVDPRQALLDLGRLSFPLLLRPWRDGDRFVPLGMTGSQKISDFLIQQKVPVTEKPAVLVLESGNRIAWVVGYRISDEYKVTPSTAAALSLRIEPMKPF